MANEKDILMCYKNILSSFLSNSGTNLSNFQSFPACRPSVKKPAKVLMSNLIFFSVAHKEDVLRDDYAYNDQTTFGTDKTSDIVLTVSFEEAARGCSVGVRVNQKVECPKCFGSRADIGFQGKPCPYCEGTGLESEKIGHVVTRKTCSYCNGEGVFIKFKCLECKGTGVTIYGNIHE